MSADVVVSTVIPTFNRWPMVREAVESAVGQASERHEIIVVDDGSDDGTYEHLGSWGSGIVLVRQENRGRSAARNAGVRAARGEYVTFLDSDDCYEPWHVAQFLESRDGVLADEPDIVVAGARYWDPLTGRTWPLPTASFLPDDVRRAALIGTVLSLPGLFIPKRLHEDIGGFEESLGGSEDWPYVLGLVRRAGIVRLPRPSVLVRTHAQRSMADIDWDLEWRDRATAVVLWGRAGAISDEESRLVRAGTHRYRAARRYEQGQMLRARIELRAMTRYVGWVTGARWAGRLWLQTFLGTRLTALARSVRERVASQIGAGSG